MLNNFGKVVRELRDSNLNLVQVWILAPNFDDNERGIDLWNMATYAGTLWGGYEFVINETIVTVITDRKAYNKAYHRHI